MSHKATYWAFDQPTPGTAHKLVLILLADWADETGTAWPRQSTIATKAQMSIRHVRDVLSELESAGLIHRVKTRRRDGRQGSDRYVLQLVFTELNGN
jgi:transcription initiation factor IIE alpha subunit